MKVYVPDTVAALNQFYGKLLKTGPDYPSIYAHLKALAERMWEGVQEGHSAVFEEVGNYHHQHLGRNPALLKKFGLSREDCLQAIANEYGFRRWSEVEHLQYPYVPNFEVAVNQMLAGKIREVSNALKQDPELLNRKSRYGHQATLLHYAVSNGVELWRQRVPTNLPKIVDVLLQAGINTQARMKVYGGEYTAAELLLSSAHPREAGIFEALQGRLGN